MSGERKKKNMTSSCCCFRREIVSFEDEAGGGIFDDVCDMCAVILCCGETPKRLDSVRVQLRRLRPLRRVELCFFGGREACDSAHSAHDLSRNLRCLFEEALARGVRRFLLLEDDFEIPRPLEPKDVASIRAFLISHEDLDIYGLGNWALPTPGTILSTHQRATLNALYTTHACIYTARYMTTVVDFFRGRDIPPDFHACDTWPYYFKASAYRFYKPLVVQTFPATENQSQSWGIAPGHDAGPREDIFMQLLVWALRGLRLHEEVQPGWDRIYAAPYVFYGLALLAAAALLRLLQRAVRADR